MELVRLLARWFARGHAPLELILYTKRDCALCAEMKAELARARVRPRFRLREVDIAGDPELLARHGRSIPVLELAGRALVKGRWTLEEFERRYARVAAELGASRGAPGSAESGHD